MKHFQKHKGLSLGASAGFSIVEVMVVVIIIGLLTALAGNRVLGMIAKARQAEAKTNLSQIHQLQGTFQLYSDNYAEWPLDATEAIGYIGVAARNCDSDGTDANEGKVTGKDGAWQLGYKPKGCEDMRYGYGVIVQESGGKERFFAVAYGASNAVARIFPTCDGGSRTANTTVNHEKKGTTNYSQLTFVAPATLGGTTKDGDLMGVSEEKVWQHDDITTPCAD